MAEYFLLRVFSIVPLDIHPQRGALFALGVPARVSPLCGIALNFQRLCARHRDGHAGVAAQLFVVSAAPGGGVLITHVFDPLAAIFSTTPGTPLTGSPHAFNLGAAFLISCCVLYSRPVIGSSFEGQFQGGMGVYRRVTIGYHNLLNKLYMEYVLRKSPAAARVSGTPLCA